MIPSTHSSKWFVCPQPNPTARMRLFLFPYAGGSPTAFNKWNTKLPNKVETWIAFYPGRGSRYNEPPISDLAALVDKIHENIQPLLDKPFAFFGHSMGGLVAFELARRLRNSQSSQPSLLFISGCPAPHLPKYGRPIHNLPDAQFLNSLRELNGTPAEVMNHSELMELLLPALRADFATVENYHYVSNGQKLACPITALGGLDDWRIGRERMEGWSLHTSTEFSSQYFPGDHFFINSSVDAVLASIALELNHVKI